MSSGQKLIVVHLGPHKTGTTSLQKYFLINQALLERNGVNFLHNSETHKAALHLTSEEFDLAENLLKRISQEVSESTNNVVILSHEDFCGDIPGRSLRKAIYPKLCKNMRIIARAFKPHRVRFVFFVREEKSWLTSCYHQSLKYRTAFSHIDQFIERYGQEHSWSEKLKAPKESFGDELIVLPYSQVADAGVRAVLEIAGVPHLKFSQPVSNYNSAPSLEKIKLLERINALSDFKPTAWFSKSLVLGDWKPRPLSGSNEISQNVSMMLAERAMPALSRRAAKRFWRQDVADILPSEDVDLADLIFELLPTNVTLPELPREDINNQSIILDYHLRGKSKLAKLNCLAISYLRRDTAHTLKARRLFHRVWREQGHILVNELSTRWLISTLQTFLDHGENEAQRLIGTCGYFYANMMKIYEGERSIEGLEQTATYNSDSPSTANKFSGLDRYRVGGTDLLLNTNALALDLATRDDVSGLVLIEFLLRVKESGNAFTRMDKTRREKNINVEGFSDTWSFFEVPRSKL